MIIGILSGSSRPTGNTSAIVRWVQTRLQAQLASDGDTAGTVVSVDEFAPNNSVVDIAMQVKDPSLYSSDETRAWSQAVRGLSGLIIVTPQYNWCVPTAPLICNSSILWARR